MFKEGALAIDEASVRCEVRPVTDNSGSRPGPLWARAALLAESASDHQSPLALAHFSHHITGVGALSISWLAILPSWASLTRRDGR